MLITDPFILALIVSFCDIDTKFVLRQVCRCFRNIEIKLEGETIIDSMNKHKKRVHMSDEKKTMILGAYNGSKKMVTYILQKIRDNGQMDLTSKQRLSIRSIGLWAACLGGHMSVVTLLMGYGLSKTCYSYALDASCMGGHMSLVKYMLKKQTGNSDDLDVALTNACGEICCGIHTKKCTHKEQLEIVKLLIAYKAKDFVMALVNACEGNNIEMIDFLVRKAKRRITIDDWNMILTHACDTNDYIRNIAIKKGATECHCCFKSIQDH